MEILSAMEAICLSATSECSRPCSTLGRAVSRHSAALTLNERTSYGREHSEGREQEAMYQYILCGLKVESDLAFPELTRWDGARERPFDVEFRLGPVERLWDPEAKGVLFEAVG